MGEWDAVLDVSNICHSDALPPFGQSKPPVWERLNLVWTAWRRIHGADAELYLVADRSLRSKLDDPTEKRQFRQLEESGEMFVEPTADPLILQLARDHGLHVISDDRFVDFRAVHPWIDQHLERFHHWTVTDGVVRFTRSPIKRETPQQVSKQAEHKKLKHEERLDPDDPRSRKAMTTRWRCEASRCLNAKLWPDQLWVWPKLTRDGTAVCPGCGDPLRGLGPRNPVVGLVIEDDESGEEILRLPLEEGFPVLLGRDGEGDLFDLACHVAPAHRDAVRRISHEHLRLRLEATSGDKRVFAQDLRSKNGSRILRRRGEEFDRGQTMTPYQEYSVGAADRLLLADTFRVRRSGRRYLDPFEGRRPDSGPPLEGTDGYTVAPDDLG